MDGQISKESNGIMNKPPNYIAHKYTFKNQNEFGRTDDSSCVFGGCCSIFKETQREVFLSPTQLITMGYFYKTPKVEQKSLKFNKNNGSVHSMQKSFFKETSNGF